MLEGDKEFLTWLGKVIGPIQNDFFSLVFCGDVRQSAQFTSHRKACNGNKFLEPIVAYDALRQLCKF